VKKLLYIGLLAILLQLLACGESDADEWNLYELGANGEREYAKIRAFFEYNHNYPEVNDWWVALLVDMVSQPEIDGVFIDKGRSNFEFINQYREYVAPETGTSRAYYEITQQTPVGIIISNSLRYERADGNRRMMEIMTGSFIERWDFIYSKSPIAQTEAEAISMSIQLMREAAVKGKILMPAFHDRMDDERINNFLDNDDEAGFKAEMQQNVTLQLAFFLIIAEKYSYFRYHADQDVDKFPQSVWDPTSYITELTRLLGKPLQKPVKNGYIYTRRFEYVDVWLNIETQEATLTWRDTPISSFDD
jgi:hypothetical protein